VPKKKKKRRVAMVLEKLEPEFDPAWLTEEAWKGVDGFPAEVRTVRTSPRGDAAISEAFCPTGKGGKIDNSCSSKGRPKKPNITSWSSSRKAIDQVDKLDKLADAEDVEGIKKFDATTFSGKEFKQELLSYFGGSDMDSAKEPRSDSIQKSKPSSPDVSELLRLATPMKRNPSVVYRTEKAHGLYKGKAVFGDGLYVGLSKSQVAEMTLDPDREADDETVPDHGSVKALQFPKDLKVLSIQETDLPGGSRIWDPARIKQAVLDAGYDALHVNSESLNFGGNQIVLYRGFDKKLKQIKESESGYLSPRQRQILEGWSGYP